MVEIDWEKVLCDGDSFPDPTVSLSLSRSSAPAAREEVAAAAGNGRFRGGIKIDWEKVLCGDSSPDRTASLSLCRGSAPAAREGAGAGSGAEAGTGQARDVIKIDWEEVLGEGDSSPDRTASLSPRRLSAPAAEAAEGGGESRRQVSRRRRRSPGCEGLCVSSGRGLDQRALPEAAARRSGAVDAAAKEDDSEQGEGSATKKSRKLDIDDEDAILHMLHEINKSVQASLKSAEPPKEASPEEIFEALRAIPRLGRADLLRAYSMLTRDDRLFRSLMALPQNMRKEWLLMEIGSR